MLGTPFLRHNPFRVRRTHRLERFDKLHQTSPFAWSVFPHTAIRYLLIVAIIGMGLGLPLLAQPAHARSTVRSSSLLQPASPNADAPLCRFGVNSAGGSITNFDVATLRAGWYIDYQASATAPRPNGIEYAPMIRLRQTSTVSYTYAPSGSQLTAAIAAHPGAIWFIGNEPDRRIFQDDMLPALYATAYQHLYTLIKAADPSARIFAGSIVQPTPVRLQYLDLILNSYKQQYGVVMPVDGWSIHNFILNEASCDHFKDPQVCWGADIPPGVTAVEGLRITVNDNDRFDLFTQQIVRFRTWMANRGYANTPLYLSEYGVLMPAGFGFPASRVNLYMSKTFDYLLNTTSQTIGYPADNYRLVQRFSWYSTNDDDNFNGYLFEQTTSEDAYQLSAMGQNYANYTKPLTATIDVYPSQVTISPPAPPAGSSPVTFTVRAEIANSGHTVQKNPVTVRFYDGDPASGGKPIGSDQTVMLNGCGATGVVQLVLPAVASGTHPIYIKVDPDNTLIEGSEGEKNNQRQTAIFFFSTQVYLPLIAQGTIQ